MIINLNGVTLSKSRTPLAKTIISGRVSETNNNKPTSVLIRMQLGFFLDEDLCYQSPTNALEIEGFEGDKYAFTFEFPVTRIGGRYVLDLFEMDLLIKAYIMKCFPNWDANLLLLTTDPDFVMPS